MNAMVEDLSPTAVLPALEANLTAFWTPYGQAPGSRMTADATVTWFHTGLPHPLFNGVVCAYLEPEAVGPLANTLAGLLRAGGGTAFWWAGPLTRPADLGARLEALGFAPAGDGPGMAADLGRLPETGPSPAGFRMERVDGAEMQALWAGTAARGTGLAQPAADGLVSLERKLADPVYRAQRRYVGFLDGVPVATSALALEAGVAGIYAVATVPQARNKGIGRLMTLMPLIEARDMGYRVGVLQASSKGRPIYEKLGFAEVGMYRLYLQTV